MLAGKRMIAFVPAALCVLLTGCRSAFVEAVIKNESSAPVSLIELDYPSASFGTGALARGAEFHYRFKILGSGPSKVLWTDAARVEHSVAGPELREGQQGNLVVTLRDSAAGWDVHLQP